MTTKREEQQRFMAQSLKHLDDSFLDCRDPSTGHEWKRIEDFHVIPAATEGRKLPMIGRKYQCRRCGTVKTEHYIPAKRAGGVDRLERVGLQMDYPDGYLLPGIPRGVKPAEIVRAEQYRRALERAVGAKRGERLRSAR